MQKFSSKFKATVSAVAVLAVLFGVYGFRKLQALAADPEGEKNCRTANSEDQGKADLEKIKAIAPLQGVKWSQLGGAINDASCLNKTEIYGIVEVRSVEDVAHEEILLRITIRQKGRAVLLIRVITHQPKVSCFYTPRQ